MANPLDPFVENAREALRLLELHAEKTGTKPGRRFRVEILNKSAIVLITACWEAFLEDCVSEAFSFLLAEVPDYSHLPKGLLKATAKLLKGDANEIKVWDLAADGWNNVLQQFKQQLVRKHIGFFNTPKASNVDELFKGALDLHPISAHWHWRRMSAEGAKNKLEHYVNLRHEIAHRVKASRPVFKDDAADYSTFITRLALRTANATRRHVFTIIKKYPWDERSLR
jgi:hypothetical protein